MTAPGSAAFDADMMAIALAMARRGLGSVAPNPAVGAVIVDETTGEVIARGWTQPGGRPHAETEAIARAGDRARGATLYVTLEPCSHHGRTPPCADAIVAAGLARVVCGIEDPDPRVAGRGLERLRAAGIAVTRGVRGQDAHRVTRGHIFRVTQRRPLVLLKMALAGDGGVPRGDSGVPQWITGPAARAHGHLLRAQSDAILIGSATARDDDPELTCRLPGLAATSPVRVVLDAALTVSPESRLVRTVRQVPLVLIAAPDADAARRAALLTLGADVVTVPRVDGALWLPAVMEMLVARGITRLLVEGGPTVWAAFGRAGLVDEVTAFIAGAAAWPVDEARLRTAAAVAVHVPTVGLSEGDSRVVGDDRMVRLVHAEPQDQI